MYYDGYGFNVFCSANSEKNESWSLALVIVALFAVHPGPQGQPYQHSAAQWDAHSSAGIAQIMCQL